MKTVNFTIPVWVTILFLIFILLMLGNTKFSIYPFYFKTDWKKIVAVIALGVAITLWSSSIKEEYYIKGWQDCADKTIKIIDEISNQKK